MGCGAPHPPGRGRRARGRSCPSCSAFVSTLFCRPLRWNLRDDEKLYAVLDDSYLATSPDRARPVFAILQEQLRRHANIRVHFGNIKAWSAGGVLPRTCTAPQQMAHDAGSDATVWRGSRLPTEEQERSHNDFVDLRQTLQSDETLLQRIPLAADVQCAWALLVHRVWSCLFILM